MSILRRLITLSGVALLAGCAGIVVGVLLAPAAGHETRAWVAGLIDTHGPTVMSHVRRGQDTVATAVDYVAAQVSSEPADGR